jgi:ribosomal protein L10
MKRQRPVLTPDLKVVGALIEGKVFLPQGVRDVSALPTLDTLRAQIVGLLSHPGMQIAALLNEAGGAKLARTLEGLKKSLEEDTSP